MFTITLIKMSLALVPDVDLHSALKAIVSQAVEKHDHDLIVMTPATDGIERINENTLVSNFAATSSLCRLSLFNTEALGCLGRVSGTLEKHDRGQQFKLTSTNGTMGLKRMYYNCEAQKIKGVVQHSYRLCSRNANSRGRSGRKTNPKIAELKKCSWNALALPICSAMPK